MLEYNVDNN